MGRKVKNQTDEFQKQIVALNKNGKTIVELANKNKYNVLKMCKTLKISRGIFYYKKKLKIIDVAFENRIVGNSNFSYGQRF